MRRFITSIVAAIIAVIPLTSYGWTRTYGGEGKQEGRHIVLTEDGDYIIVGYTGSEFPEYDLWLLKVGKYGDTVWTRTYAREDGDWGEYVTKTSDGGFIIAGYTNGDIRATRDIWLLKTDSYGDTLWTRIYGDSGEYTLDDAHVVQETQDNGYILIAQTPFVSYNDLWLLRLDEFGDTIWTRQYEDHDVLWAGDGQLLSDGGCVVTCGQGMIRTDSMGEILWECDLDHSCKSVHTTSDGGFITAGVGTFKTVLQKVNDQGNLIWTKQYPGFGYASSIWKTSIIETNDGGYLTTGFPSPYGREGWVRHDIWLVKTDVNGDTLWTKTYGGYYPDESSWVIQTPDGGYAIIGLKGFTETEGADSSDIWLLKTNEFGDTVWFYVSPKSVALPKEDTLVDTMIPASWFKNYGTMPAEDFYCHCEIVPKDGDEYLSPPYHVKYWISYSVEPGDSIYVQFAEWFADDSARYEARFYTTKEDEPIWTTDTVTVEFQGVPDVGIIESPIVPSPSWELTNTVGSQMTLRYSNYPQGFHADIFDAAGRKVDELKSVDASGSITWGDTAPTGVYFIRISSGARSAMRKVILLR